MEYTKADYLIVIINDKQIWYSARDNIMFFFCCRCMKAEITLKGLLTEQSMSLARSGASEHSSLLLEPQRFHGDSAGI